MNVEEKEKEKISSEELEKTPTGETSEERIKKEKEENNEKNLIVAPNNEFTKRK